MRERGGERVALRREREQGSRALQEERRIRHLKPSRFLPRTGGLLEHGAHR
ncbi:MAG: hypothetical protein ABIY46_05060 [Gemmatimonadales bacterium]